MIHLYTKTQDGDFVYEKEVKCENCKHWDPKYLEEKSMKDTAGLGFCQRIHCTTNDFNDDKHTDAFETIGIESNDHFFGVITHKDFGCALYEQKL